MTREQIEKAANIDMLSYYSDEEDLCGIKDIQRGFIDAFSRGAQWRINSVWHDASEKPNKNQLILFECRKTYGKRHSVDFGEIYESIKNVIVRWAYIIDLLPERKEETK